MTSAGSRSGVNCSRRNPMPSACANDRAVSVLPRPGRSSSSTCPPARIPARTSSSASRLPTTTVPTCVEDRARRSGQPRPRASVFIAPPPSRRSMLRLLRARHARRRLVQQRPQVVRPAVPGPSRRARQGDPVPLPQPVSTRSAMRGTTRAPKRFASRSPHTRRSSHRPTASRSAVEGPGCRRGPRRCAGPGEGLLLRARGAAAGPTGRRAARDGDRQLVGADLPQRLLDDADRQDAGRPVERPVRPNTYSSPTRRS